MKKPAETGGRLLLEEEIRVISSDLRIHAVRDRQAGLGALLRELAVMEKHLHSNLARAGPGARNL